jgi:hypothetical protein
MSALALKAAMCGALAHVRFVPEADIAPYCAGDLVSLIRIKFCQRVRVFEQFHVLRHIVTALLQIFGVPLASLSGKKIAAIDVNGARQPRDRIGHRMNDIVAERLRVANAQSSRTRGFNLAAAIG